MNRHIADQIGGSEMQCDNIARELTRRGYKVTYLAVGGATLDYDVPYTVVRVAHSASSIASAAVSSDPDIVYWRLNKFHFLRAARKIKRAGIPIIFAISHINDTQRFHHYYSRRDFVSRLKAVKQSVTNAVNYLGFRYVDAVTTLNSDLVGLVPVPHQVVIANCIDSTQSPFTWPRPFVIWVATIKSAKRPELYVRLAQELSDTGVDFLMVGPIWDDTYNWISEIPQSNNFFYVGQKTPVEVNGMMQESLFLVHTCFPEGFGNNFIQAWYCGRPTISYGYDPQGLIGSERLGVNANNQWNDFVCATREYIDNDQLRSETGNRAEAFSRRAFSAQSTVNKLASLIEEVA